MQIVFFEVEDWEKEILLRSFPEAHLVAEPLTIENVSNFTNAEVISTFIYSKLSKEVLSLLPNLKYITTRSTGYDHIETIFCKEKGILVSNVPEYGSTTVAEYTFALLLSLTRRLSQSAEQFKTSTIIRKEIKGCDLNDKVLGVIGSGKIGQNVLRIANGFGMKTIVYDMYHNTLLPKLLNFEYVELDYLIKNSDIVTLHLPLTAETHHMINKNNILDFKRGSFFINTARGGLVDTEALILGLEKGILAGVGLDVIEDEKNLGLSSTDHALLKHPNVLITPHNAYNTNEATMRILQTTIENIKEFIGGKPTILSL